jgi:tRNA (cytidine56-2'-O)-methyltransferase
MPVTILRLSHRIERDKRLSTHIALASRALGAKGIIYSGERDLKMEASIKKVVKNWGGDFSIRYAKSWRRFLRGWKGKIVHLTVYGERVQDKIKSIRKHRNILVVVGGEKVPGEVYQVVDYNIGVSQQPHSEAAALGIFLHEYFKGKELEKKFPKAKLRIVPQESGKLVKKS